MKALLHSTNTAFDLWSGQGSIWPIVGNVFHYAMYPLPGLLAVGNDLGDSLIGSLVTSGAIQLFAVASVGLNYNQVKKQIAESHPKPAAILPSAVDAAKYLSHEGNIGNLVRPALMRLPLMATGPLALGNSLGAILVSATIGTILMEWSVVEYVQQELEHP